MILMVERAADNDPPPSQGTVIAAAGRFARDADEFAVDNGGDQ